MNEGEDKAPSTRNLTMWVCKRHVRTLVPRSAKDMREEEKNPGGEVTAPTIWEVKTVPDTLKVERH